MSHDFQQIVQDYEGKCKFDLLSSLVQMLDLLLKLCPIDKIYYFSLELTDKELHFIFKTNSITLLSNCMQLPFVPYQSSLERYLNSLACAIYVSLLLLFFCFLISKTSFQYFRSMLRIVISHSRTHLRTCQFRVTKFQITY